MICRSIDSLDALLVEYLKVHPVTEGTTEQYSIAKRKFVRWYAGATGRPFQPACFSESVINDFLHAMIASCVWGPMRSNTAGSRKRSSRPGSARRAIAPRGKNG
jgi:hypothetical protein